MAEDTDPAPAAKKTGKKRPKKKPAKKPAAKKATKKTRRRPATAGDAPGGSHTR